MFSNKKTIIFPFHSWRGVLGKAHACWWFTRLKCSFCSWCATETKAMTFVTYKALSPPRGSLPPQPTADGVHVQQLHLFELSVHASTLHTWPLVGKLLILMLLHYLHQCGPLSATPPSEYFHLRTLKSRHKRLNLLSFTRTEHTAHKRFRLHLLFPYLPFNQTLFCSSWSFV